VRLLITHGLPGSGKTSVGRQLLERVGAIRARSDIERKRMAGLAHR
jgi:predicted kinase